MNLIALFSFLVGSQIYTPAQQSPKVIGKEIEAFVVETDGYQDQVIKIYKKKIKKHELIYLERQYDRKIFEKTDLKKDEYQELRNLFEFAFSIQPKKKSKVSDCQPNVLFKKLKVGEPTRQVDLCYAELPDNQKVKINSIFEKAKWHLKSI